MSKCVTTSCRNEGWAAEPITGVTFCHKHWGDVLAAIAQEKAETKSRLTSYGKIPHRQPKVYFLKASGHIKIGVSMTPMDRMSAIRSGRDQSVIPDAVRRGDIDCMGFIPGSRELEAQLHKTFDRYRVKGEWFIAAPEMVDHINQLMEVK